MSLSQKLCCILPLSPLLEILIKILPIPTRDKQTMGTK